MTWQSITGMTPKGHLVTHVIPVDDLHEHYMSDECWCCPELDDEHWVATHNSADRREEFESGARKPS
jgi:hypothetical protein